MFIFSKNQFVKMLVVSIQKTKNNFPHFFLIISEKEKKPVIEMKYYVMSRLL